MKKNSPLYKDKMKKKLTLQKTFNSIQNKQTILSTYIYKMTK